ncbi:hypothetical protein [Pseudomonas atacamensis]|uniref:hypothetical protein n=1 Tax=Pseudomonas atacamensis TaxID=2565368 RepID=UPI0038221AF5
MDLLTAANLFPVQIPLATKLETPEHYHGGIAIGSIEEGVLKIVVDAWLNMAIDDKCELYWDDDDNPVDFIRIDDLNINQVEFYVPVGFITNGSAKVFYRVTRFPQEPVKSNELLMWVKLTRPADVDTDSEPGHSGLSYTLVPDPSKGVDSEMAEGGIRMYIDHYRYIATYDRIICKWEDEDVSFYPITQAQIDDPDNNPIFVTFTEDVIRGQGNGPDKRVSFRVVDRVGNTTDPLDPSSKITYVSVDLRLPAPTIWVNNQNVTTIDLKVLGTSDAAARVYFAGANYQAGDKVVLTWAGTTSGGQPVIVGPLEKTVDSVPSHHDFPIPNAKITAIVNGSAKVGYQLLRANVPARPSNNAVITVTGEVSQLKPPTVVEAPDYKLDPNRHQNGFTVVFDTAAFGANHEVKLEIAGRPGAGSVPPQQKPVAGQSKVQFDIDFSVTGANLQRSVELIYSLIVNGQPTPVQSVTLMIGELLQSSMPMPKLEGFDGEVLDVGLIKDDTKVLCGAWPFQRMGLPIWLEYVETFAGGGERVKEQFVGAAHDQGVGLSYLAEVEWLRGCKADSRLVVILKVGFYSGAVESEAVACQVRSYGVKAGLDDLTTFDNYDWNHWALSAREWHAKITLVESEYFLESIITPSYHPRTAVSKCFQGIEAGTPLEFSFDHRSPAKLDIYFSQNEVAEHYEQVAESEIWQTAIVRFYSAKSLTPGTLMLWFFAYSPTHIFSIKNLRLRRV